MATTLTSTVWARQPMRVHAGTNTVAGTFQYNGNTVSASEIIWLAKIPAGATITDGYIQGTSSNAATIFKIGTSGAGGGEATLQALATLSATAQRVSFLKCPVRVSCSDSNATQYVTVYLTLNSGTVTTTGSLSFMIEYVANTTAGGI